MTHNIKNIIFDLGGVLLNIDYNKTTIAFENLGIKNFNHVYSQAKQNNLFDSFETGFISEAQFVSELKNHLSTNVSTDSIITSWNAMLLHFPKERIDLLKNIRKHYNIILLSNTNETHIRAFENIIFKENQLTTLNPLFDKVYFSSKIGLRKPNKDCFEFVLNDSRFNPDETIFFDDSIQHIEGAITSSIKAVHVDNTKTILDFFAADYKLKSIPL